MACAAARAGIAKGRRILHVFVAGVAEGLPFTVAVQATCDASGGSCAAALMVVVASAGNDQRAGSAGCGPDLGRRVTT